MDKLFAALTLLVLTFSIVMIVNGFFAILLMWTWNVAMVHAFSLPSINWIQSFCMLMLTHLLFENKVDVNSKKT